MDNEILIFPKGISLKLNVIALLEFELVDYNIRVQHVILLLTVIVGIKNLFLFDFFV